MSEFEIIVSFAKHICTAYTGFTKTEIAYLQQSANWNCIKSFLASDGPYEAIVHFTLNEPFDVIGHIQLFIGCMVNLDANACKENKAENQKMNNLLFIIDNETYLDAIVQNSKMMRFLLALNAKYQSSGAYTYYQDIFYNAKRILAHIFKKFPQYFQSNILKSNFKSKRAKGILRFNPDDVEKFL